MRKNFAVPLLAVLPTLLTKMKIFGLTFLNLKEISVTYVHLLVGIASKLQLNGDTLQIRPGRSVTNVNVWTGVDPYRFSKRS